MSDLAFAFGCFHFGLKKSPESDLTIRSFMREVEDSLKAVPNVDNIQIDCDPEAYDKTVSLSGEPFDIRVGAPYPYLPDGKITFDVLIPLGAQRELLKGISSGSPQTFTERFRVEIFYEYHFPIAVFQLMGSTSKSQPSDAVVIVRELLQREFQRQQESLVDFQFLGPSPLHADFYLTAKNADNELAPWSLDLDIEYRRGYDKYDFSFNRDVFASAEEALDNLLIDMLSELDVHYLLVWIEQKNINKWDGIDTLTGSLVDLYQREGFKAFFARTFKATRSVNDTFVALAEFEGAVILSDNMLRNSYRTVYSSDTTPYIREIVDRRMEDRASYPTDQVRALLQLFETRRLNALELRVVLISAISGGVFGGLVSVLWGP